LLFASFINYVFFLSYYFQAVQGRSARASAVRLLPYVLGTCVGSTVAAVGVFKIRFYNPFFMVGGMCLTAASALITFTFTIDTPLSKWFSYEVLLGLGVGFCIIANVVPGQTLLREEYHSISNGLTFLSSMLGSSVSMPVSSTIFNKVLTKKIIALGLPPEFAAAILHNPSRVRHDVPADVLPQVLNAMMETIKKVYLFGLAAGIAAAIVFCFLPWNPLIAAVQRDEEDHHNASPPQRLRRAPSQRTFATVGSEMEILQPQPPEVHYEPDGHSSVWESHAPSVRTVGSEKTARLKEVNM